MDFLQIDIYDFFMFFSLLFNVGGFSSLFIQNVLSSSCILKILKVNCEILWNFCFQWMKLIFQKYNFLMSTLKPQDYLNNIKIKFSSKKIPFIQHEVPSPFYPSISYKISSFYWFTIQFRQEKKIWPFLCPIFN